MVPGATASTEWRGIASSADGGRGVATAFDLSVFGSADGGANWVSFSGKEDWSCIASSADAIRLAVGYEKDFIYTTTNAGKDWTNSKDTGPQIWSCIASSSNGAILAAGVNGGSIFYSEKGGASWTELKGMQNKVWSCIAGSSDGTMSTVYTTVFGEYIYAVTNNGTSWNMLSNAG